MPWASPPCTWPSTMSGLICTPQSSTQTYERSVAMPVSVSTSMAARCVPWGYEKSCGSTVDSPASMGSMSSGRLCAVNAAHATAWIVVLFSGSPLTENVPALNSMSSGLTSSWCAAMSRAFSTTRSPASLMAWPPTASEREP